MTRMVDPQIVSIASASLHASISALGAELVRLHTATGTELLWDGDPAVWNGRSPLLFPVVGNVKNDRIAIDGKIYALSRHGFARTSTFELVEAMPSHCRWRLTPSAETRARYPFAFRLDVTYALDNDRLTMSASVANEDERQMPVSFGFHPAFRWPLEPGSSREHHEVRFETPEPAPIRRPTDDGLLSDAEPSPLRGNRLVLADELFERGALVWDRLASRSLTYGGASGPVLRLDFPDMPHLGIWTKPGAGYVCLEPWQGFASPVNFDGELAEKPGIVILLPGSTRLFELSVTVR